MTNLTDNYYGQPCKQIYTGSTLSQDQKIEFESKYPNYEVKEIGYEGDNGYVYVLAIFSKKDLIKFKHAAGGYQYKVTEEKGNTLFREPKKNAIIKAILDEYTEGVYTLPSGKIKRQLLNGCATFLKKDYETGEFYFSE